ncbi:MAG: glucose 1-dehydrogenase [Firmicutes bacterium]|nr:glucose 1-dehydrogenase [Bacillota bacterium]
MATSQTFPPQQQPRQPGIEADMKPLPQSENPHYRAAGKLTGKTALITGGDSGIGRAVAVAFAKEGADVAIVYLNEHDDAKTTRSRVEQMGRRALAIAGDVGQEAFCTQAVAQVMEAFGRLDILVNNAGEQHPTDDIAKISAQQLERTFRTNFFGCFFMVKAVLPHLQPGSAIIHTTSITAYEGNPILLDYSASKGAIVAFTRSLALSLSPRGIRVNAVAPGPVWTPLIPASFAPDQVASFGADTSMRRAAQPAELAPAYLFLACDDSSYMSGQVLHVNGGTIVES